MFGLKIISTKQWKDIKAQLGTIDDFALSEVQKVVAALKATDIGKAVAANIKAIENDALTGLQKFETVVSNTVPLIVSYVTGGDVKAALSDLEHIARELTQSVFNDGKVKGGSILTAILRILGVK